MAKRRIYSVTSTCGLHVHGNIWRMGNLQLPLGAKRIMPRTPRQYSLPYLSRSVKLFSYVFGALQRSESVTATLGRRDYATPA
jgi:hypothetical protein